MFRHFRFLCLFAALSWWHLPTARAQTDVKLLPDAFEQGLRSTPVPQLLDVRTREEFAREHLAGALNADYNGPDFSKYVAYLDKSKPTYVYCLSGGRSAKAAAQLRQQGFAQVYELNGGILQWKNYNKPVEKAASANAAPGMTVEDFEKRLATTKLVLVDFGAKWCPPCKKMAPILEKIGVEFGPQLDVLPIDVDQHAQLIQQKQVIALPTLWLYKNQRLVWQQTGFADEATLRQIIQQHLGK